MKKVILTIVAAIILTVGTMAASSTNESAEPGYCVGPCLNTN